MMTSLLLTPNQRLAATLIKRHHREQMNQGLRSWLTPAIRPLGAWIQELWKQLCAQEMKGDLLLLTADQELILWEEVIAEEPVSSHLLKLSDLAKQAKSAWSTLKLWQTGFDHPSFAFTDNARHFQAWAARFEERCLEQGWVDEASLRDYLLEAIQAGCLQLPKKLTLLNFTELAPQYRALLKACEERGVVLDYQTLEAGHSRFQVRLENEEMELAVMVRWAKNLHQNNPQASIGCIVADLEDKREALLVALSTVFENPASYNISAGRTLASYPVIQEALALLRLPTKTLSFSAINALLHSPFLGDAENEMLPRIHLDKQLRRRNPISLAWAEFLTALENGTCPLFSARLRAFQAQRKSQPALQSISQWLTHFAELLEILGWPGEQSLNSTEYQVIGRWLELLLETSRLDLMLEKISAAKALHYLTVLAVKTYFQPESPEAVVQILGQLEGAGLPFDYLWIQGLDDTAWPPPPSPNPLLPQALQRSLAMPNATAERQLDYSRRLTQQYQHAAPLVIFSYAGRNAREELRPSPLIVQLEAKKIADLDLAEGQTLLQLVYRSRDVEHFRDEQGPALRPGERLRGGISLFEMQAACPFKAFARLRLDARALEEPEPGLPAKSRGSVIHKALEFFWKDLRSQQNLLELSEQELEEKTQQVLRTALAQLTPFIHPDTLYYGLLQKRLQALLLEWLALEKIRPPFKIAALEEVQDLRFADFPLSMRVDRVDEVAGGEKLIIDYKTRKSCDTAGWFGERLDEPQLPLYCLTQKDRVAGLAFAQLHSSQIKITGLSRKDLGLDGLTLLNEKSQADALTWEAQLEQWRLNLHNLFLDFQNGIAITDPKKGPETCRSCDLQSLCRIHEDHSYADAPLDS